MRSEAYARLTSYKPEEKPRKKEKERERERGKRKEEKKEAERKGGRAERRKKGARGRREPLIRRRARIPCRYISGAVIMAKRSLVRRE